MENLLAGLLLMLPALVCGAVAYWALESWFGPLPLIAGIAVAGFIGFTVGGFLLIFTLIGVGFLASLIIGAGSD
jgi:uncharacterized membrane protein